MFNISTAHANVIRGEGANRDPARLADSRVSKNNRRLRWGSYLAASFVIEFRDGAELR
jgi:hypothetical protein